MSNIFSAGGPRRLRIESGSKLVCDTRILLDDADITEHCTGIELRGYVDDVWRVRIEFLVSSVECDIPEVSVETKKILKD